MIIIDDIEQQSPEWFALHAGVPGASSFSKIVDTKGISSDSQEGYLRELVAEKFTGTREKGYSSFAMQQGNIRESEARTYFELITGKSIRQVGFVFKNEDRRVGCSPDGLFGDNGKPYGTSGIEIKCPEGKTQVEYLLKGKLPTKHFTQVQGSMWVCNAHVWTFMAYVPNMPELIIEIKRDYKFTSALDIEMELFLEQLDELYYKLKDKI